MKFFIIRKILLFVVFAPFFGCVNKPGPVPFYPVPPEVEPYFLFRKGSYWIYEEINSFKIDSVYLYQSQIIRQEGERDFGYDFELYLAGFYRSNSGDSVRGYGHPSFDDEEVWMYEEDYFSTASPGSAITFLYRLDVGQRQRLGGDFTVSYASYSDSTVVNGQKYFKVMEFRHAATISPNHTERIYYAKNVGVIKRELFNGEVWELKEYFINN